MSKFARTIKDTSLFLYILLISFQIQTFISVGTEIFTGRTSETTLYKGLSFVWSILALVSIKIANNVLEILTEITKDIKALKAKKHLKGIKEPTMFGGFPHTPEIHITDQEIENMNFIEKILQKKARNEPGD